MSEHNLSIISWNVQGLNCPDRRTTVHEAIFASRCNLLCIQESKLAALDAATSAYLGGYRLKGFAFLPALGTRGGIILLWNEDTISASDIAVGEFYLSAMITLLNSDISFKLTKVYGPTDSRRKDDFFAELLAQKPATGTLWLANGDFNQIYKAWDKNKRNANISRINRFRNALNACELKEIHLQNRKFTWSNERLDPTLCKLDTFFCNSDWDIQFSSHALSAMATSLSDHCPLILASEYGPKKLQIFRFENFWIKLPGFGQVVAEVWGKPTKHTEPCRILAEKLRRLGVALRRWSNSFFSSAKLQLTMALEVILGLDMAMDLRPLSPEEWDLRMRLKRRVIGYAILERARKRQASRIRNLKEGDANTKFFHIKVNARRRKNFIRRLRVGALWACTHKEKEKVVHDHFSTMLQKKPRPHSDLNWNNINFNQCDMSSLDEPFSEHEALDAIGDMPKDKAPGPDGFTGAFFKASWEVIKADIMAVVNSFADLRSEHFQWVNTANVVLLPKKDGAESISDFRPISLIHAVAKIVAKMMATRLAPFMHTLISIARAPSSSPEASTIILCMCNLARRMHRLKKPTLLFKLDIKKAFDFVRWDYLLSLLSRRGFPTRFRDMLTALLQSSSSRVLLNGIPGEPMWHGVGLWQGEPLSPLLFVLAIDPIQSILDTATRQGKLHRIGGRATCMCSSLYADDAAIFVAPFKEDIQQLTSILAGFGEVTGFTTNLEKSSVVPISCSGIDLDAVLECFPAKRATFPMRYLGLPLSIHRLRKIDLQHLVDKAAGSLVPWQGRFITAARRTELVRSVTTSQATFHATAIKLPESTLSNLNKLERAFLWAGAETVSGGQCKVNWKAVCRPKSLGGLGVLDLHLYARALRLRWLWYEWKEPDRPWVGLGNPCDSMDRELFYVATTITVGDGRMAHFWHSPWLEGKKPKDIAPLVFASSSNKNKSVKEAMQDQNWVHWIKMEDGLSVDHIAQFCTLWEKLSQVELRDDLADDIKWNLTTNGTYSSASAYKVQFEGAVATNMKKVI